MERIEVEAETMISDFGADAYFETRRIYRQQSSLRPISLGRLERSDCASSTVKATRSSVDREPIAARDHEGCSFRAA
jgi:hypothetical protein